MLLLLALLTSALSLTAAQTQCDLEHEYMLDDIAIPSEVTSEPLYQDDPSKVLTEEEQALEAHHRSTRAAVRDRSRIWPDNTVPYIIDPDFNDYYKKLLRRAMDTWEEATCIKFITHSSEKDYIHIKQGRRCCSYVGRQRRGAQRMALDPGCMQHGILLHELGHVIGFWHEQNRPDRDDYIRVIKNYHHSVRYNFQKLNESQVDHYGVEYDYSSIMHYGKTFFSIDGKRTTLEPLKKGVTIGQRLQLSPLDKLQANRLYMCQEDCSWTFNTSTGPGEIRSMNYPDTYPPKLDCISKILAREGQVVRLLFDHIDVEHHSDCNYDFIEIRDGELATSKVLGKFCGDLPPRNFTSSGPAMWVKFHSDSSVSKSGFLAHYTAFAKDEARITKVDPCDLKTCAHTCSVINDVATCLCPAGFHLNDDGYDCNDYNECEHNNGGCSHICLNSQGSFKCMCPRGYNLGNDTRTCIDIDECQGRSQCSQLCINTPGSYYCTCRPGFRLLSDYATCADRNECEYARGGCDHGCRNYDGGFACTCNTGYRLASDNSTCIDVNECEYNNGGCEHECNNEKGGYSCECYAGYTPSGDNGTDCTDINECSTDNGHCEHQCINSPGSYQCTCNQGYTVPDNATSACKDINECEDSAMCERICVNEPGSYYCACPEGFTLQPNAVNCIEDIVNIASPVTDNDIIENYSAQPSYCGELLLTHPGPLTSPLYPYFYPTNTHCTWVAMGQPDETVVVTFLKFDLEDYPYCRYDSLALFDGLQDTAPQIANLCGRKSSAFSVQSHGSKMRFSFTSDYIFSRQGFSAIVDYHREPCGGRLYVRRFNRQLSFSSSRSCTWTLTADHNRQILLNFVKFKMSGVTGRVSCPLDQVFEAYSENSLIARYCGNYPPPKLRYTSLSEIQITIQATQLRQSVDVQILYSSKRM